MGHKKILVIALATFMSFTSIGCGNSFKSIGQGDAALKLSAVAAQVEKAQKASLDAQRAIQEANAAISEIMDSNGQIRMSLFSTTADVARTRTAGIIAPLLARLNPVFDRLFARITSVKVQFATARASLMEALNTLNAADPSQIVRIEEIKAELAKIDALEMSFRQQMHQLGGRLDLAVTGLERLINLGTSFIPVPGAGAVAGILIDLLVTSDVRDMVAAVRFRLQAV